MIHGSVFMMKKLRQGQFKPANSACLGEPRNRDHKDWGPITKILIQWAKYVLTNGRREWPVKLTLTLCAESPFPRISWVDGEADRMPQGVNKTERELSMSSKRRENVDSYRGTELDCNVCPNARGHPGEEDRSRSIPIRNGRGTIECGYLTTIILLPVTEV
jgi:hypothetical protein